MPSEERGLSLDVIVAESLRLIEADGLEALTMRRLADRLGIKAASLYWYVRNRDQLLDLIADKLVALALSETGAVDAQACDSWYDLTYRTAVNYRSFLLAHRDSARIITGRFVMGPNLARILEPLLKAMRAHGFSLDEAAYAIFAIFVYVHGFVLSETSPLGAPQVEGVDRTQVLKMIGSSLSSMSSDEFPNLIEATPYLTEANLPKRFIFGLTLLLEGLSHRKR